MRGAAFAYCVTLAVRIVAASWRFISLASRVAAAAAAALPLGKQ